MAENRLEVTHLLGKKLDKPILIKRGLKTENKMEQVAKMFGKKLGEHFRVKDEPYNDYVFTEEGLYVVNTSNAWVPTQEPRTLHDLLTGKTEIMEE